MEYCKKQKRNCPYKFNIVTWTCRTCVEKNLSQYPVTCLDCRKFACEKCGKHERRRQPCNEFVWD